MQKLKYQLLQESELRKVCQERTVDYPLKLSINHEDFTFYGGEILNITEAKAKDLLFYLAKDSVMETALKNESLQEKNRKLKEKLNEQQSEIKHLTTSVENLGAKIATLTTDLDIANAKNKDLQKQLDAILQKQLDAVAPVEVANDNTEDADTDGKGSKKKPKDSQERDDQ